MLMRERDKLDEAMKCDRSTPFNPPWGYLFELAASDEGWGLEGYGGVRITKTGLL